MKKNILFFSLATILSFGVSALAQQELGSADQAQVQTAEYNGTASSEDLRTFVGRGNGHGHHGGGHGGWNNGGWGNGNGGWHGGGGYPGGGYPGGGYPGGGYPGGGYGGYYQWSRSYIDYNGCNSCQYSCNNAPPCSRYIEGQKMSCRIPGTVNNSVVYTCVRY